jgi:ABC-2 type transport system ATP-binding protein
MLIDIRGLKLSLRGVEVLHDVNLSLDKGEIYGLLGPNGAGKSTTIAATLGLVVADAGHMRVLGKDPRTEAHAGYARIGVLPEQHGFYDWMTAAEYLAFFAALYKRHPSRAELGERLARVGLDPRPGQHIGTFSRGMRQRLGLARALVAEPEFLILDEPTNGLDPRGRREIHDILLDLSTNHGVGVLLCTHLLDDVDRLCTRIGVIVEGRSVAEGVIADLVRTHGQLTRFRLRLDGPVPQLDIPAGVTVIAREGEWCIVNLAPEIDPTTAWRELLFMGWPIIEVQREGGGIEDLYLRLTEGRKT